jgi:hypothetical protein
LVRVPHRALVATWIPNSKPGKNKKMPPSFRNSGTGFGGSAEKS